MSSYLKSVSSGSGNGHFHSLLSVAATTAIRCDRLGNRGLREELLRNPADFGLGGFAGLESQFVGLTQRQGAADGCRHHSASRYRHGPAIHDSRAIPLSVSSHRDSAWGAVRARGKSVNAPQNQLDLGPSVRILALHVP